MDDKARKIQQIANGLGWNADINLLIDRVKQIDNGLVQEDEFTYLLNWSGKCRLIHKLDQFQMPHGSKTEFTIPDLFALFEYEGKTKPFLIEVKTSKDKKLSWTETYYNGLINYSKQTGIPILIAWKWRSFDIWTLFELKHFEKGPSNYKISFETAHKENLMSQLAGDFVIIGYDETSLILKFKKLHVIEKKGNSTTWQSVCESISAFGKNGKEVKLDNCLFAYFLSLEMEEEFEETDDYIIYKFKPSPDTLSFAQSAPIRLAYTFTDGDVNWTERIRNKKIVISQAKFFDSIQNGIKIGAIRNILLQQPRTKLED